ncbi:ABC transporter permease [Streptomyces gulbargensis]|uniref:ABC transporter permease n=1 Tax=Streptomyces gulbargensis TaxID=364901 RepID=A0ABP7M3K4_9ACTN
MTGFVLLRARAHRLLLVAALLSVLLTTSVLATLAAFSGSVGDAALQAGLRGRSAPSAALFVTGQVPAERRGSAETAVRDGMRRSFDGLPVTVRRLERSGPYALPRNLQPPAARAGEPDLTHLAALDRSRLALVRGAWPAAARPGGVIGAAVPQEAAARLRIGPGTVLDLTDRIGERHVRVRITGVYRPVDTLDPYWRLDPAGGRGVRTVSFTTYGPLHADPAVLASGALSPGDTSWAGVADFTGLTTDRMDALRAAAASGPGTMAADTSRFGTAVAARTGLPAVLEQTGRALGASRSTLAIVAVQLVLLAGYALLLVARLLGTERAGETALLRARGASRRRIAGLAATEALLPALPAALAAPLLAGPLTRLLTEWSALSSLGVRLDTAATAPVWLAAALVALCCAAAVVAPSLAAGDDAVVPLREGRAAGLPAWLRAGADLGLLVIAGVAYAQLRGRTGTGSATGAVDPVLVAAPALALLAGTVLTLRLLPPAARLAERYATRGRGLSAALAGWQFSRRPMRGAGPVLLLALAVAMGVLAIGQNHSWERSQRDQADFRAGTAVRVLGAGPGDPARTAGLAAVPGVRAVAPVHRTSMDLAGRSATVLAVDTRNAAGGLLLRPDLAGGASPAALLGSLAPAGGTPQGLAVPAGSRALEFDLRTVAPAGTPDARLTAVLEDPHGVPYRQAVGTLPADGRTHELRLDLGPLTGSGAALTLTGLDLDGEVTDGAGRTQTLRVERLATTGPDGTERIHAPGRVLAGWTAAVGQTLDGAEQAPAVLTGRAGAPGAGGRPAPYSLAYPVRAGTGVDVFGQDQPETYAVRLTAPAKPAPASLPAVATEAFMAAAGARPGERLQVSLAGRPVDVTVRHVVRELPTTGGPAPVASAAPAAPEDGGAVLVDLAAANRRLAGDPTAAVLPTEWWLTPEPGRAAEVARVLRSRADTDAAQIVVRDEIAASLLGDPLGAGPNAALMAVAAAAAALAAAGFAVGSAGALRERSAEFGVLRALGAPRRRLARLIAAEQSVLVALGLLVGLALGTVVARAVVPLVVLTTQATRPVPPVLITLPPAPVALLLAGVAALPLAVVTVIALRRTDPGASLRRQGDRG